MNYKSESGVSLIEISVLLIVLGILSGPVIYAYQLQMIEQQVTRSEQNIDYIRDSLVRYALETGRYPIPAVRNLTVDTAGAGEEYNTALIAACVGGDTVPCRAGGNVLIGDVPFKELGINPDRLIDGYRSKVTYAITEALTDTMTFADNGGNITMLDFNGANHNDTSGNVHFVVVSHGRDRSGAFSFNGTIMAPCIANSDQENCDNDAVFNSNFDTFVEYERSQFLGAGATYYDDYVAFVTTTQGSIWSYVAGAPNMRSLNNGNALIGGIPAPLISGATPRPEVAVAKLEVMGNVRTDVLTADRLCNTHADGKIVNFTTTCPTPSPNATLSAPDDVYDENVFDPGIIAVGTKNSNSYGRAGGGIRCLDQGLRGIANSDEECTNAATPAFAATMTNCPPGEFPRGTDSTGAFVCVVP